MTVSTLRKAFYVALAAAAAALSFSCASPGHPSGGMRDEDPPRYVRSNPPLGATNFDRKRVSIEFNELVNVKDAFSKVVISPTSASMPRVSSSGRRVYIDFPDTLEPNTTYTVDFGNAIEDNNEANKLQGFSYWFSTGPEIDSLRISGMVLAAQNLEPQQGMIVGVHSLLEDSVFRAKRLERVAKTDDRGRFTIRGLKPGKYRVFALADANNDFRWDNPQEDIAFTDFLVEPYTQPVTVTDTIYDLKTGRVDSTYQRLATRFLPNNILLNSFNVDFKQQYLVKNERQDSTRFSLIFNAPMDSLPLMRLLGVPGTPADWFLTERSARNDSITLWLRTPELVRTDTLELEVSYLGTAKDLTMEQRTDTLRMITNRPRPVKKKRRNKKDTVPEMKFLDMSVRGGSALDVNTPLVIEFPEPLAELNTRAFRLEEEVDSVWRPARKGAGKPVFLDSLQTRKYKIDYPWEYGGKYRLTVDSIAATGIYGLFTKPLQQEITVKDRDQYFDLTFRISSLPDSCACFVELLNSSDSPVVSRPVENGVAVFRDVPLGTYYARLVEDRNGNGRWDTGSYDLNLQPEYVYYYPKALKITKRWDLDQPWDLTATAIDLQKPAAIKKNKPERDKRQKTNTNDENPEEDDVFDPTRNPFDPNDRGRNNRNNGLGY